MLGRNPVGWFEIYVEDLTRARAFYESVFEKKLTLLSKDDEVELWSFPCDPGQTGSGGALVKMAGVKPRRVSLREGSPEGMNTMVYFSCENCAVEEGRVAISGGSVLKGKHSISQWGFMATILDTEGNMIGLHSSK